MKQGSGIYVPVSVLPVQINAFGNLPGCCYRPWFGPLKKHVGARVTFYAECSFDNLVQTVLVHVIDHTVSFIYDLNSQGPKPLLVKYRLALGSFNFPFVILSLPNEGRSFYPKTEFCFYFSDSVASPTFKLHTCSLAHKSNPRLRIRDKNLYILNKITAMSLHKLPCGGSYWSLLIYPDLDQQGFTLSLCLQEATREGEVGGYLGVTS